MVLRPSDQAPFRQPLDKRALLRAHPFFRDLDAAQIERLAQHTTTRKVKKGTVIFRKGDAGACLYAVTAGTVRISTSSEDGKDATFNLVTVGQIFGEIACLDGGERTASALAIEDGELIAIERRDFVQLVRDRPEVAIKLIEVLCSCLRRTSEQVEDIIFLDLQARLAKVLLQLHRQSDASHKIRVTQREISQMIGVSRESANKQLRSWQRRKWLRLERGGLVILAPDALDGVISHST
jgi:CRP/FNR family transcriptional regulator, cyclic AMP receptor protein